ncbi:hypothetical protein SCA6_003658 [Theobroma cacao]
MESSNVDISLKSNAHFVKKTTDDCVEMKTQKKVVNFKSLDFFERLPKRTQLMENHKRSASSVNGTNNMKCHNEKCVRRETHDIGLMIFSKKTWFNVNEEFKMLFCSLRTLSKLIYLRCIKKKNFLREKTKVFKVCEHNAFKCKKRLKQDIPTWWNSTFLMVESALYFHLVFSHCKISESNFKTYPSRDDWDRIEKLSKFLSAFYEITCVFFGTKHPTTYLYFPSVFMARMPLQKHMNGDDVYMKNMSMQIFPKFDKYWSEFSVILARVAISDPRYKI